MKTTTRKKISTTPVRTPSASRKRPIAQSTAASKRAKTAVKTAKAKKQKAKKKLRGQGLKRTCPRKLNLSETGHGPNTRLSFSQRILALQNRLTGFLMMKLLILLLSRQFLMRNQKGTICSQLPHVSSGHSLPFYSYQVITAFPGDPCTGNPQTTSTTLLYQNS